MNRNEKIKVLNEIQTGKATVNDLIPKSLKMTIGTRETGNNYFINNKPVDVSEYWIEFNKQSPAELSVKIVS